MGLGRLCAHFARMPDRNRHHVGPCLHCGASAGPADTVVTTEDQATRYLEALMPDPEPGSEPPVYIPPVWHRVPTVQGAVRRAGSGYVWQRYAYDLPKDLVLKAPDDTGFVMPEAQYAKFSKVYEAQQGDEVLIG